MLNWIVAYLGTGIAFALVDAVWLTRIGPNLYRPALDPVLADQFRLGPAVAFYLIYIGGILALAVAPALREGGWTRALLNGALVGFLAYATYDLTNHATLKVWELRITLLDIAWGTFLTAVSATAGYFAWRWAAQQFG